MTEQEELLKKYEAVPFDKLTIVNGMRVLKSIVNGKPCIYTYPQILYVCDYCGKENDESCPLVENIKGDMVCECCIGNGEEEA